MEYSRGAKTVTVIGDGFVGKSSIVRCLKEKPPVDSSYRPTIMDTYSLPVRVRGRQEHLVIWDTSGQEDWAHVRKLSFAETAAVLIVFDISDRNSLDNVFLQWFLEVSEYCPRAPVILVGNKKDLRDGSGDKVDCSEGNSMAKKIGAQAYVECSAVTNEGIDDLLQKLVMFVYRRRFCLIL